MSDHPPGEEHLVLTGKWLASLRKQVEDMDFCVLCDNHPSHGHDPECPLDSGEKETL